MATIDGLKKELAAQIGAYQAVAHKEPAIWRPISEKVKALQKELQASIVLGARKCKTCGNTPIGIAQPRDIGPRGNPKIITVYEVGCAGPCGHRVFDTVRENAVSEWNEKHALKGA